MKRSTINQILRYTKECLSKNMISLPDFAYYSPSDWKKVKSDLTVLKDVMLGWDITDYGRNDFSSVGTVLFTIRNGAQHNVLAGTPYAEKMLFLRDGQRLPLHYHECKTEDIINRGGGDMFMILYNAKEDGGVDYKSDVSIYCDGVLRTVKAGEEFIVTRGNSVTLSKRIYHIFGAKAGGGDLVSWEVSSINDDKTDNYFAENVSRFSEIEEDEEPLHVLCNEYEKFL